MKPRTPLFINIITILFILVFIYYMFVQNISFLSSPYFWGTAVISIILTFIHHAIGQLIENENFKKLTETEKAQYLEEKNIPYFKRLYNSAFKKQSAVEESDILIDHGFDGIKELDNALPKWWLGLFYFGIVYAVIYMIAFAFTDFARQDKEYIAEHKEQLASIAEYEKTAPPITVETAVYKNENIAEGEQIFNANCATCHGAKGKGMSGPNLTDNFWINQPEKTLFKSIFHVAYNGSPKNPVMQAFGKNGVISSREIEKVAAYIYHINQEVKPITVAEGGTAPQGTEANWAK